MPLLYFFFFFVRRGCGVLTVGHVDPWQANAEGITERLSDQVNAPISKLDATSFKNIIRVTGKVRGLLAHSLLVSFFFAHTRHTTHDTTHNSISTIW